MPHDSCDDPECTHEPPHLNHGEAIGTWSYKTDEPISLYALREMVKHELPSSVYRCKAVIHVAEHPDRRAVLQCVGRRTDVTLDGT